jgi:hypothetical protein
MMMKGDPISSEKVIEMFKTSGINQRHLSFATATTHASMVGWLRHSKLCLMTATIDTSRIHSIAFQLNAHD